MLTKDTTPRRPRHALLAFLVSLLLASPASAWLRAPYEDAEVVERSPVIVVGRLQEGSIRYVPHNKKPGEGASWEHTATLAVDEVVKGKVVLKEFPIVIHYGLTPVIGDGRVVREQLNRDQPRKGDPADAVRLIDTGSSSVGGPLADDLRRPNVWFLRRRSGTFGREPGDGDFGVVDPEDVAAASLTDYFRCYLAADPERAVREYLARDAQVAARATRYLHHREVQRILKVEDPAVRVERLLPYCAAGVQWGLKGEARDGLVAAGKAAGPYLLGLYHETRDANLREDVVRLWGEIGYAGGVPLLIEVLDAADRYWAAEQPKLEAGWWNREVDSPVTARRREVYGQVYSAVTALGRIADPRGRDAVARTRNRWAAIAFENPQIVEACDAALKRFAATDPAAGE